MANREEEIREMIYTNSVISINFAKVVLYNYRTNERFRATADEYMDKADFFGFELSLIKSFADFAEHYYDAMRSEEEAE